MESQIVSETLDFYVKGEAFLVVTMNITDFWKEMQCFLVEHYQSVRRAPYQTSEQKSESHRVKAQSYHITPTGSPSAPVPSLPFPKPLN